MVVETDFVYISDERSEAKCKNEIADAHIVFLFH